MKSNISNGQIKGQANMEDDRQLNPSFQMFKLAKAQAVTLISNVVSCDKELNALCAVV